MNKNVCPTHPDAHLVEDYRAGDMICSECGLVVGDRVIDVGSEWRTFSANDKNNKVVRAASVVENVNNISTKLYQRFATRLSQMVVFCLLEIIRTCDKMLMFHLLDRCIPF